MKLTSFFKLLNRKIKQYDKYTSNPFEAHTIPITIVWIEENNEPNTTDEHS